MGRAAEKIGVAQPALSQQIKLLEHQLKTPLFYREKRGIRLTEAGEEFLAHARAALKQANMAMERGRRAGAGEVGRLKFGYVPSVVYCPVFRRILMDFRKTHPDVDVSFFAAHPNDLVRDLEQDLIDVAIVRAPLLRMSSELTVEAVSSERLVVAMPHTHRLANMGVIAPEALANEDITTTLDLDGIGLAGILSTMFGEAGIPVKISRRTAVASEMTALVACGFGIAVVPASLGKTPHEGVVVRPLDSEVETSIVLIRRTNEKRAVPRAFLESHRRIVAEASLEKADAGKRNPPLVA
ncbi:LysR family transcriptional regulator [Variibacter gotjawalensis]|nr:LysR family transcriptional regulator [Variibacter gotjawalensis]NIK48139.1 DNA-binding transcriptional LysR family regulator [Variibacter gotjawalensis]